MSSQIAPSDLITLAQASEILPTKKTGKKVSVATLKRWGSRGKITLYDANGLKVSESELRSKFSAKIIAAGAQVPLSQIAEHKIPSRTPAGRKASIRIAKLRIHSTGQYFVKLSGKCYYLGKDPAQAEYRYREKIVEHYGVNPHNPGNTNDITVTQLLDRYVANALATTSPSWKSKKEAYYKQVTRHAKELYGELAAEYFGPKAFKAVRDAMSLKDRRKAYVNSLCMKLRRAWKWGVSEELVSESSYRRLITVGNLEAFDSREVQPVPQELYEATIPFLSGDMSDFVRLLWLTAARPGELLTLTPSELEIQGDYYIYRPRHHKTARKNKRRAIVFGPEGIEILKRHQPKEASSRYFPNWSDVAVVRNSIYRACDRAYLQRWHPYQLRHAAITRIALEHGREVAQATAGHSNLVMTQHYDHGNLERAKKAAGLSQPNPPATSPSSFIEALEKLASLKDRGILNDAEFLAAKSKLLQQ